MAQRGDAPNERHAHLFAIRTERVKPQIGPEIKLRLRPKGDAFRCLTRARDVDTLLNMPRAIRVKFPGAIYYVVDRGDCQEDIFMIATAKGAKNLLHESRRGTHQPKSTRADEPCAQLEFQSTARPLLWG